MVARQEIKNAKKRGFETKKLKTLLATSNMRVGNKVPSEEQLSKLLKYYQNGRYGDAEKLAISITQEFPENQFSWKVLGVLLGQTGRNFEAVNANQIAIKLSPQDADAHNNLGVTYEKLGKFDKACSLYIKAISLNKDFTDAYINLSLIIKNFKFTSSEPKLYPILMSILKAKNAIRPQDMASCILSLLYHDPLIKGLITKKNVKNLKEFNSNLEALA
ncbi:tetratricopeptide repeat protein, partial [bacterium]|nr:tetratricopeptide repeat protein [bacterium]